MFDLTGLEQFLMIGNAFFMIASVCYRYEIARLKAQLNYPKIMAKIYNIDNS